MGQAIQIASENADSVEQGLDFIREFPAQFVIDLSP
jgi:hypothetical protein